MASVYPGTLDSFTNPIGSDILGSLDHAGQHSDDNDAIENIQAVLGTTAGTSVLKNFTTGTFAARTSGETFTNPTTNIITFQEGTAPSTPASGYQSLYSKTDGKMYYKNSGGTEKVVGGGGLSTWFNIADYGAVGNGTVDDSGAIGSAIAAIPSAGGILYIPAGTYYMGTSLNTTKPITVIGEGINVTTILLGTSINTTFWDLGGDYASIHNVGFNGNVGTNNVMDFGLLALTGDYGHVDNCSFTNMRAQGLEIYGDHVRVNNSRFVGYSSGTSAGTQSMALWANGSPTIDDLVVDGCFFLDGGLGGIFGAANNSKIVNCYFKNNHRQTTPTGGGQIAWGGTGVVIANNTFDSGGGVATSGMEMNAVNCSITGNTIIKQGLYGIALQQGGDYTITGNIITGGTLDAISVFAGMQHAQIVGNHLYNNTRYGIEVVSGSSNYYMITNNIITGNGTAAIADNGTGTSKLVSNNILA